MGNIAIREVVVERDWIDPPRNGLLRQGQECFQLAGEDEPPAVMVIDERLLSQPVASEDQLR